MGRISTVSVLAGALCGLAALEVLTTLGGALAVAINGGTNFAALSDRQFKTLIAVIAAVAVFCSFVAAGYVSGRMSRRSGAFHGLLAGVAGTILSAVVAAVVIATGTDVGLARVARHIQVADTWHQWRSFGLVAAAVGAAAMVLGGLAGGVEGEEWHGKLLTRAVDPSYGPEAAERAEAQRRITEAEVARLSAAGRVGHVTGAEKAAARTTAVPERAAEDTVVGPVTTTEPAASDPTRVDRAAPTDERRHHLLGRR